MTAVLGIIKTAPALERAALFAAGTAVETGVAVARSSKAIARVAEQRKLWTVSELDVLPKWARIANQNDFTAKMSQETMEHWRTRVFQPDLTPSSKNELKIPYFYKHPFGIEVESHHVSDIPARVYEGSKNSVLRIDKLDLFGEGSGAIVDMGKEKVLATATHVIQALESPTKGIVNFADGTFARIKDIRLGSDPANDVAMIFVDKDLSRYPALTLGESKSLLPKERLFAFGHPCGSKTCTMSIGNLEDLNHTVKVYNGDFLKGSQEGMVRSTIRSTGGLSGGPLVRWNKLAENPEMVGIHSTANNEGANAVASEDFLKFVERWRPEAIAHKKALADHSGEAMARIIEI